MAERAGDDAVRDRIKATIRRNVGVLNRLEPHLGCAICHGPLTDGRCPDCQKGDDDG